MKLRVLLVLLFLMGAFASSCWADDGLSAKHKLTACNANGNGSLLTFDLVIANDSDGAIANVKLVAKDPLVQGDAASSTRYLESLAPGSSVRLTWTVLSTLPPGQLRPGMDIPFSMIVSVPDAAGNGRSYELRSKGGDI